MFLLAVCIGLDQAQAERGVQIRSFPLGEGYYTTLTVSPRGNVLANHSEAPIVTILDGYEQRNIPADGLVNNKVYESRSGQLWSIDAGGLLFYDRGKWSRHSVPGIASELRNNATWQFRAISLVPAELNHVLVLLPNSLIEYDASTRQLTVLKEASELPVQRFLEMQESSDGGLWITTSDGFIKVAPPLRRITSETIWQMYRLPAESGVQNLQRPFEDADMTVITVGTLDESPVRKAVVRLVKGEIEIEPLTEDRVRQVWKVWDKSEWAMCFSS
ncbi:MAG: hypothetical protein EXS23_01380, partial [Pedosphaera sp.]|nr:hypothetical protein [Pedosphaera sp.]